jgi:hypothetical protein
MTKPTSVSQYLKSLPAERRAAISAVRDVVNDNLPDGFAEMIDFGMIVWAVPLDTYPDTYNGRPLQLAALASQKQYMSLYLLSVYGDPATKKWFEAAYKKAGKKLDMGKSCLRFKTVDDVALDVVGEAIGRVSADEYVRRAQAVRNKNKKP